MKQAKEIPNKIAVSGKNVRISKAGHEILQDYCKSRGYTLGAFCEIAALNKMNKEQALTN